MDNTLQGIKTATSNNDKTLRLLLDKYEDDDLLLSQKYIPEPLEELASLEAYIISCRAKEKIIQENRRTLQRNGDDRYRDFTDI
jgi:hypothetical protein